MTLSAFCSAVIALLLTPGPTNTLIGLAGARQGLRSAAALIPAEVLGYLTTTLPLVYLGSEMLRRWPSAGLALKVAAALWVMALAVKLWRKNSDAGANGSVTFRDVYLTTVLNPKALIFGLVLLPAPVQYSLLLRFSLLGLAIVGAAAVWVAAGALTQARAGNPRYFHVIQRLASAWLATVSITLITGVLRA